jgi:hypothetical protein
MNVEKMAEIIDVNVRTLWSVSLGGSKRDRECFERLNDVFINDLVVETSSVSIGVPAIKRVGYLREIYVGEDGWDHYIIETLDGNTVDWVNCRFIKVLTEFQRFSE